MNGDAVYGDDDAEGIHRVGGEPARPALCGIQCHTPQRRADRRGGRRQHAGHGHRFEPCRQRFKSVGCHGIAVRGDLRGIYDISVLVGREFVVGEHRFHVRCMDRKRAVACLHRDVLQGAVTQIGGVCFGVHRGVRLQKRADIKR